MSARRVTGGFVAATAISLCISSMAVAQERPISGPIAQPGQLSGQRLEIEAGTEDDTASLSLELFSRRSPAQPAGPNIERHGNSRFSIVLSTPWNGKEDAAPATLNGLANGTSLTFRFGRFVYFSSTSDDVPAVAEQIRAAARADCETEARDAYDSEKRRLGLTDSDTDSDSVARRRVLEVNRDLALSRCARPPAGPLSLINQYQEGRVREYVASLIPRAPYEWGIEASIGRNGFEHVDPTTLAQLSDTKVQWSARVYFSQYLLRSRTSLAFSVGYERAYEAADEAVFCPPNPNNEVIRCTTAAGGPPELNESLLISAGIRHQFDSGVLSGMAVSPLVTYDALDDVFAVDLPIYILPDGDGGLTGALRLGYRTDRDDEFSVGVFIGTAFRL